MVQTKHLVHATSLASVLDDPRSVPYRYLSSVRLQLVSNFESFILLRFHADFVAKVQAKYHTLDMRHIVPLEFPPSNDRSTAEQLIVHPIRDALSGIVDVADPTDTITSDSPGWVCGMPSFKANEIGNPCKQPRGLPVCTTAGKGKYGSKRPCQFHDSFDGRP